MPKIITSETMQELLPLIHKDISNKADSEHSHDEFTPMSLTLENYNNTFSIGEDNTGTKYDVIESSESTVELNGRTLVNLWGNKTSDFIMDVSYEYSDGFITLPAISRWNGALCKRVELFKPSTTYTIICNITSNTLDSTFYITSGVDSCITDQHKTIEAGVSGVIINTFTTRDSFTDSVIYSVTSQTSSTCTTGSITFQCIVLEGDYTNVPIEYFEGLKSVGETNSNEIIVKSVGKNLFNEDKFLEESTACKEYKEGKECYKFSEEVNFEIPMNIPNNKDVCVSFTGYLQEAKNQGAAFLEFKFDDGTNKYSVLRNNSWDTQQHKFSKGLKSIVLLNWCNGTTWIHSFIVSVGSDYLPYEPYKENISTITLTEPLRSLPNGVKDEIFVHDDKLVVTRNVGQVMLDGSEGWSSYSGDVSTNNISFQCNINDKYYEENALSIGVASDKFCTVSAEYIYNNDIQAISERLNAIRIKISKTLLTSEDLNGFKTWLQSNNVTVVYQLKTPTYEWFELPSPRLYKDGHVFIESGSVPLATTKHEVNTSIRSAIDTNTNELWDVKNNIIDTNERIDEIVDDMYTESSMIITENNNTFTMSDIAKDTSDIEIKLNGRTLVNLIKEGSKPTLARAGENEGRYTETYDSNGKLTVTISENLTSWRYINCGVIKHEMLKPSTTYTVFIEASSLITNFGIRNGGNTINFTTNSFNNTGNVLTFTTVDTLPTTTETIMLYGNVSTSLAGDTYTVSRPIILEGDYTNVPISYFEGLQSAKPTKLLSCGKNLLDLSNLNVQDNLTVPSDIYNITSNDNTTIISVTASCGFYVPIYLKKGKTYLFNGNISNIANMRIFKQGDWVTATNYLVASNSETTVNKSITWIHNDGFYNFRIWVDANVTATITDFQIEEGISRTQYEPYKGDSVTLPTIQPLRSLPNGVCDVAEFKDDKLVITRKCQMVDLSTVTAWEVNSTVVEGYDTWHIYLSNFKKTGVIKSNTECMSDTMKSYDWEKGAKLKDEFVGIATSVLTIRLAQSRGVEHTTEGIQTWLANNQVNIVYELKTPTIETYDLRTLHIYKHFFAETGAIPLTSNEHNEHYNTRDIIIANTEELLNAKRYISKLENTIESLVNRIETLESKNSIN